MNDMNTIVSTYDDENVEQVTPVINRREFVKGSIAGAASISLFALAARQAGAAVLPYGDDYGPVAPVNDQTTGLPLIALPAGFTYKTFGWRGQSMADGTWRT